MSRGPSPPSAELVMRARIARRLNEWGWSMNRIAEAFGGNAGSVDNWFKRIGHKSILKRGGVPGACVWRGGRPPAPVADFPRPTVREKVAMTGVVYEDVKLPPSTSKIVRVLRPFTVPASSGNGTAMCGEH